MGQWQAEILDFYAMKRALRALAQIDELSNDVTQLFAQRGCLGATWCNHLAPGKMIIPGGAETAHLGRQLGDVIGFLINLRKHAQCSFLSIKVKFFSWPIDPPRLNL